MVPVRRLNHAVLFVSDLDRAVEFYTGALGMSVVATEPRANAAFLAAAGSDNHHDLGLFGLGQRATQAPRGSTGLYHLAWQVDSIHDLVRARDTLAARDAYTGESDHGATKSIYGADPDGNELEIMWLLPQEQWGTHATTAGTGRLDLAAEVARHG